MTIRLSSGLPSLPLDAPPARVSSLLNLTRLTLGAPDLATGIVPTLEYLIKETAAVGAAYFQLDRTRTTYQVQATSGELPATPSMQVVATHGLPNQTPLIRALEQASEPLFFDHTGRAVHTEGFPKLGVASLAAAPVRGGDGTLLGTFLMHTLVHHTWQPDEVSTFSWVSSTVAALAGRLAAEQQAVAAREAALRALGLALEVRDGETQGHTDRVTALAIQFSQLLGWPAQQQQAVKWGAYLHDIGKIAIPDAVLLKAGPLTPREWEVMRSHVGAGERFARALEFLPSSALNIIADHHERWDGTGYPMGKAGLEISLEGRMFALCDVYDALTHARPYKQAWTSEAAKAEIVAQSGRQFDPALVDVFLTVLTSQIN